MLNGLDVFSRSGELTNALQEWVLPLAYCETDRFHQVELLLRMSKGELPTAPLCEEIEGLKGDELPEIDIIYGFLPYQDSSTNGSGEIMDEERSELFRQVQNLICEIRPRFVYIENVPATNIKSVEGIHHDFFDMGYDCRWGMASTGRKEKWFMLSYEVQTKMFEKDQVSDEKIPEFENYTRLKDLPRPDYNIRVDNIVDPNQSRQIFAGLMGME